MKVLKMLSNNSIENYNKQISQLKEDRKQTRKEFIREWFKIALILVLFIISTILILDIARVYLLIRFDIAEGYNAAIILGIVGLGLGIVIIQISKRLENKFQFSKKINYYNKALKSIDYQINFISHRIKRINKSL